MLTDSNASNSHPQHHPRYISNGEITAHQLKSNTLKTLKIQSKTNGTNANRIFGNVIFIFGLFVFICCLH